MSRESDFRDDLKELLDKHCARLVITDDGKPYGLHSPVLMVEIDTDDDFEEFEY
jgi:hypothetical protein